MTTLYTFNMSLKKEPKTFIVQKEILYQYFKTGNSGLQQTKIRSLQHNYQTTPKNKFAINPEVIKEIETLIELPFAEEQEDINNVCFANSLEVRDDFKVSFSTLDILHYTYAVFYASAGLQDFENLDTQDTVEVVYPTDSDMFWHVTQLAKRLKQKIQSSVRSHKQHDTALHNILGEIRSIIK